MKDFILPVIVIPFLCGMIAIFIIPSKISVFSSEEVLILAAILYFILGNTYFFFQFGSAAKIHLYALRLYVISSAFSFLLGVLITASGEIGRFLIWIGKVIS